MSVTYLIPRVAFLIMLLAPTHGAVSPFTVNSNVLNTIYSSQKAAKAISELRELTEPNSSAILNGLSNGSPAVKKEAVCAALRLEVTSSDVVSELFALLENGKQTDEVAINVLFTLFQMSSKKEEPRLLALLNHLGEEKQNSGMEFAANAFKAIRMESDLQKRFEILSGLKVQQSKSPYEIAKEFKGVCVESRLLPLFLSPFLDDGDPSAKGETLEIVKRLGKGKAILNSRLIGIGIDRLQYDYMRSLAIEAIDLGAFKDEGILLRIAENTSNGPLVRLASLKSIGILGFQQGESRDRLLKIAETAEGSAVRYRAWESILKVSPKNDSALEHVQNVARDDSQSSVKASSNPVSKSFDLRSEALETLRGLHKTNELVSILRSKLLKDIATRALAIEFSGTLGSNGLVLIPDIIGSTASVQTDAERSFLQLRAVNAISRICGDSERAYLQLGEFEKNSDNRFRQSFATIRERLGQIVKEQKL